MRTLDFVTKESLRRKRKSLAGLLFILLATGIFVACQTINKALHDKAKEQLLRFGANILVRPKGAMSEAVSDAVGGGLLLPQRYVDKINSIEHSQMLVAVSPKLYERFPVNGESLQVVGIMPDEMKAKPWWTVEKKVIGEQFPAEGEVLLGHYAAARLGNDTSEIRLDGRSFKVSGTLDETGSPDDFMGFVSLPTLQELVQKPGMTNLIEVSTSCIACKAMNINDVANDIDDVLPADADVVLVRQIAEAQMGTLQKIEKFTVMVYLVILGLCLALLANYMSSSVDERRREIGILMAMGMPARRIQGIFIAKMMVFAGIGGCLGWLLGTGLSIFMGPMIAEATVAPISSLLPIALLISFALALISCIFPVRRISRLDPVDALREL